MSSSQSFSRIRIKNLCALRYRYCFVGIGEVRIMTFILHGLHNSEGVVYEQYQTDSFSLGHPTPHTSSSFFGASNTCTCIKSSHTYLVYLNHTATIFCYLYRSNHSYQAFWATFPSHLAERNIVCESGRCIIQLCAAFRPTSGPSRIAIYSPDRSRLDIDDRISKSDGVME